jgi:glutamate racemase
MKIAFFDSGIGGLTVLREAVRLIPNEKYIYCSDSENAPYGCKSKDEVRRLTLDAVGRLEAKDIKALVVACNTATSAAIDALREKYPFPVIGMEPAVKLAVEKDRTKKVLVLATSLTLKEEKFNTLIKKLGSEDRIDMIPLQKLVEFAERHVFFDECVYSYLREELGSFDLSQYGSIVLGCTHFSFFTRQIGEVTDYRLEILDGNKGTARQLRSILEAGDMFGDEFGFEMCGSGKKITDGPMFERYLSILTDTAV